MHGATAVSSSNGVTIEQLPRGIRLTVRLRALWQVVIGLAVTAMFWGGAVMAWPSLVSPTPPDAPAADWAAITNWAITAGAWLAALAVTIMAVLLTYGMALVAFNKTIFQLDYRELRRTTGPIPGWGKRIPIEGVDRISLDEKIMTTPGKVPSSVYDLVVHSPSGRRTRLLRVGTYLVPKARRIAQELNAELRKRR